MAAKNLFAPLYLVLIFGNSQCYESVINQGLENLSENYAKWVQKTWTPDMFAYQGRTSSPQSNLLPSVSEVSSIQYSNRTHYSLFEKLISQCTRDLWYTTQSLKEEWAIRMLDSDGKLPSGLLGGNFKWPGDYKECIKIYAPRNAENSSVGNFHGRYCTATWQLNMSTSVLPLSIGMCIPDTCDGESIKFDVEILLFIIERFPVLKKLENLLNLTDISCKPLEVEFDGPAIGMMFLLSVFGLLMIVGSSITIFEYFVPSKKKSLPDSSRHLSIQNHVGDASNNINDSHVVITDETVIVEDLKNGTDDKQILVNSNPQKETHAVTGFVKSFFKSFCVFTNGAKILNTDVTEGQLLCIHGIRFLSMAWVILGHSYAFAALSAIANLSETISEIDTWEFQVILQGTLSVDTFFVLSGFLLTYLFLQEADKREGKISWPFFYIHRYWRLTPVYMITLGFDVALTRYLSSGPFWSESGFEPACKEVWWRNLLYINNFGDSTKQCFGWSWYLANDMQFYIISPFFLYALWSYIFLSFMFGKYILTFGKNTFLLIMPTLLVAGIYYTEFWWQRWPKVGLSIVCTLLLSSWITTGIISTENHLLATYSGITQVTNIEDYTARMADFFWKMYVKPYTRIGPYLIGVLLGYLLYKTKNRKRFLEPWSRLLGWSVATALVLFVIFGVYDTELSNTTAGVFNALSRSTFALGLAWVIYACLTGHGDVVNKILSWKMFIPLSRLTYCAYLVHPIIIVGFYQSLQQPLYFSHFVVVALFFGFLILSYTVAFITSLALESPMMAIEKLLLRKS